MPAAEALLLAVGAAAGSLVFGISGFAFSLTASIVWLQYLSPQRVVPLVVICPMVLNLVTLPTIRRDLDLRALLPLAAGSTIGVPLGVLLLAHADAHVLRVAIGALLTTYAAVTLVRGTWPLVRLAPATVRVVDASVGLGGGVLGGVAGLSAVLPSLWIGLRGGSKPSQRALLQAFGLYSQVLTLAVFAGVVGIDDASVRALALCLPIALAGSVIGLAIFRRLSGDGFRRAILWIVLAGGLGLLLRPGT